MLRPPASTALLRPSPRLLLLGATAGGLMVAATYLLYPLLARLLPLIATDAAQLYAAFRAPSLVVASIALVPVIVGEELVWRGVVQTSLVQRLGPWRGVALAALLYALVHVPLGSPLLVAVAFGCGLAWGALRATHESGPPWWRTCCGTASSCSWRRWTDPLKEGAPHASRRA
ncbi:MAG: CPBP family intramembrane metalloprotease [Proteobacteria bacterium]|nr:CPBP family intramembrane metalloprotease [Pseudomonadota bacterium]